MASPFLPISRSPPAPAWGHRSIGGRAGGPAPDRSIHLGAPLGIDGPRSGSQGVDRPPPSTPSFEPSAGVAGLDRCRAPPSPRRGARSARALRLVRLAQRLPPLERGGRGHLGVLRHRRRGGRHPPGPGSRASGRSLAPRPGGGAVAASGRGGASRSLVGLAPWLVLILVALGWDVLGLATGPHQAHQTISALAQAYRPMNAALLLVWMLAGVAYQVARVRAPVVAPTTPGPLSEGAAAAVAARGPGHTRRGETTGRPRCLAGAAPAAQPARRRDLLARRPAGRRGGGPRRSPLARPAGDRRGARPLRLDAGLGPRLL